MSKDGASVKTLKYDLLKTEYVPIGCEVKNGQILPALTAEDIDSACPPDIVTAAYSRNMNYFFAWDGEDVFMSVPEQNFVRWAKSAQEPFLTEFRENSGVAAAYVLDTTMILQSSAGRTTKSFAGNIACGVFKSGRLFGADRGDRRKLRWSGEGGISDWEQSIDGAGWAYTDGELGEIYNLAVFKDRIAAVRALGVSLVSAYGTPENFKLETSAQTPRVYKNTAAVCGDKLYFCTRDGLFAFDGAKAERVENRLLGLMGEPCYAVSDGNALYIAGTLSESDKGAVFVYEPADGSAYLIDCPAGVLCEAGSVYAFCGTQLKKLSKGGKFDFRSGGFGYFNKRPKALKSVFVECGDCVEVTVETDKGKRVFKNVKGRLSPNMRGRFFKVGVKGQSKISELYATVEYF